MTDLRDPIKDEGFTLVKFYALLWALFAVVGGGLYFSGNFGEAATVAFWFAFSALFFAGPIQVLPWMMERHYSRYMRRPGFSSDGAQIDTARGTQEHSKRFAPRAGFASAWS